nr:hypothetical protein [Tanacetum cinerariifolium]
MVSATKDPLTFNDLMATPIDFSKYVLNQLKIENLTQDLMLGPACNLLKGTCTSSIGLEYNLQECFNALRDKLEWNNPEGDRYPSDLSKPLPLQEGDRYPSDLSKPLPLQGLPDHLTIVVDYFFNNDLEYLKTSYLEKTYTTSITKTKAARYKIVGIEDTTPRLWSTIKNVYDKDVERGSRIRVKGSVSVKKLHGYGYLEEDSYTSLKKLGVESYQKKLNITAPHKTFPEIEFKELYTPSYKPPRVIYEDLNKQKRVMRADELYKFSDGILKTVRDEFHHRILSFCLGYNTRCQGENGRLQTKGGQSLWSNLSISRFEKDGS